MPLHLKHMDFTSRPDTVKSALIVSCPVCPPVSLAIQKDSPLIDFFRGGFKAEPFEDHIKQIRQTLEQRGIETDVFITYVPIPTMCLWTENSVLVY